MYPPLAVLFPFPARGHRLVKNMRSVMADLEELSIDAWPNYRVFKWKRGEEKKAKQKAKQSSPPPEPPTNPHAKTELSPVIEADDLKRPSPEE